MMLFKAVFLAIAMLAAGAVLTNNVVAGLDDTAYAAKKSTNSQKKCKSNNCNP